MCILYSPQIKLQSIFVFNPDLLDLTPNPRQYFKFYASPAIHEKKMLNKLNIKPQPTPPEEKNYTTSSLHRVFKQLSERMKHPARSPPRIFPKEWRKTLTNLAETGAFVTSFDLAGIFYEPIAAFWLIYTLQCVVLHFGPCLIHDVNFRCTEYSLKRWFWRR